MNKVQTLPSTWNEQMTINHIAMQIRLGHKSFLGVELPKAQMTGTQPQCNTYASQKARDIYETNFKNQ